jgi:hypothetical protein
MKQISMVILILLIGISLKAQYKKASFFNKSGRTYEITTNFHFSRNLSNPAIGFSFNLGRMSSSRRSFSWWGLECILPANYSFQTIDASQGSDNVTVSGKSNLAIAYNYNVGYFLMNNSNEKNKLLPFINMGYDIYALGGMSNNYTYAGDELSKVPSNHCFTTGLNFGAGAIYNFSDKYALRLNGGYNFQFNLDLSSSGLNNSDYYYPFPSHPFVNLGIMLKILRDE